jgi:hypothetical protein
MYTNIFTCIIFAVMAVACLVAGFYIPFHFFTAGICIAFVQLALFDDTEGKSLWQRLKDNKKL